MFKDGQFTKELPNNQGDYYDDQCTNRIDKHICNLHFWIDVIQSDCSKEHVNIINIQSSFRNKRDCVIYFFGNSVEVKEKDCLIEQYGILKCSKEELKEFDEQAVKGVRENPYGVEALVDRSKMPKDYETDMATLEEIIVFLSKGQEE